MSRADRIALRAAVLCSALLAAVPVVAQHADMMDDDLRWMIVLDELEWSDSDGDSTAAWDADLWAGTDLHRLWLKTEGERVEGETESSEIDILYSRAVRPFWDLQAGFRHESRPAPARNWAVIGIQGLAPYWFEVEASLAFAEDGQQRLHARASYELLITQRLILEPEGEVSLYGEGEPARLLGAGISQAEIGVRLRYEIRRELAPYVGFVWREHLGDTADALAARGLDPDGAELVIGIRFWH